MATQQQSNDMDDLRQFIFSFIRKQREHINQHIVCEEDLLIDLIRLEDKAKKAFLVGMPLANIELETKSIRHDPAR